MLAMRSSSAGTTKAGSNHPQVQISSDQLLAKVYVPDVENGFYRGTRFDWSGVISSLECAGHRYYGAWYTKFLPEVHDFIYDNGDIVAGLQSAITGPAEEFPQPQGYGAAKPGATFVKLGVGVLRKLDDSPYSSYGNYEIIDSGTWSVRADPASVEFEQAVTDPASGCGYQYRKTMRVASGRSGLAIEHSLRNIGRVPIEAEQYNHNFLTLDSAQIGPDFVITFPYPIQAVRPDPQVTTVEGNEIRFVRRLANQDAVSFPIVGFGMEARDYDFRVENRRTAVGVRVTGDRPLTRMVLWSIRTVLSIEPFIDVSCAPGESVSWTYTYSFYTLDA